MSDARDWALTCVLGARDRTDNEEVRQGLLDAHRMLVAGQPTDEPTEADPECPESATADGCHCKCERGTCCWCGTDRPPTVTPFPLNDEPTRADECIAALRSWAEEERYTTTLAGHALTVLDEIDRLRALVGGRSAASTREQDDERPDDSVRRTSLGAQRLVAAIDAHVAKTHEPLAAGKDPAVAAQLFSEDSIELLLKAREVVALLSRSAAGPNEEHEALRAAERGFIVAPWTDRQVEALNAWQRERPVHPFTCGKRDDHESEGVLTATREGWVCEEPDCDYAQDWAHDFMAMTAGVAAGPQATPDQVLWEGETTEAERISGWSYVADNEGQQRRDWGRCSLLVQVPGGTRVRVVAVPTDPTAVRVSEVRRPVPGARDMTGNAVPTDHEDRIPGFEHSGPCLECDSPHRQGERCAPTSQEDDHAD